MIWWLMTIHLLMSYLSFYQVEEEMKTLKADQPTGEEKTANQYIESILKEPIKTHLTPVDIYCTV